MEDRSPIDIEEMKAAYHLMPPSPYDERLRVDNLPLDFAAVAAIRREIEEDPSLDPEQKGILKQELSDRWGAILDRQAKMGLATK